MRAKESKLRIDGKKLNGNILEIWIVYTMDNLGQMETELFDVSKDEAMEYLLDRYSAGLIQNGWLLRAVVDDAEVHGYVSNEMPKEIYESLPSDN